MQKKTMQTTARQKTLRTVSLLGLATLAALGLGAARPAGAQALLFDDFSSTNFTSRPAGDTPGTIVTVAQTTTIGQIGVDTLFTSASHLKYVIFDDTTHSLLYQSLPQFYAAETSFSEKDSDPFSFTLLAGTTYDIGYVADTATYEQYSVTAFSQSGLSTPGNANANFSGYDSPVNEGQNGKANVDLRLYAPSATAAAPEPSSVAAFAFTGLGAAGLILRARKRRTVA